MCQLGLDRQAAALILSPKHRTAKLSRDCRWRCSDDGSGFLPSETRMDLFDLHVPSMNDALSQLGIATLMPPSIIHTAPTAKLARLDARNAAT